MKFAMVLLVEGSGLDGIDVMKETMMEVDVTVGNAGFCGW